MSDPPKPPQIALPERYEIQREIARTGMSRVYLARERRPERLVAIKVLDANLTERLGRERFLREVDLTSSLSHPHIVPIFAAGDADGALYYVMPFIQGETLGDKMEREGRLPIAESLRIAKEVADALQHAHSKGIIHRDIKPGNVLLQEGHALVADFGIARVQNLADQGSLTQAGHSVGTPDYMSPEQAAGQQDLDGRTDMYSLVCVLFEMLTGVPPFSAPSVQATLARHLTEAPPSARGLRESIDPEIDGVIERALQKAPEDRFASMEEFHLALADAESMASADKWTLRHGAQGGTHPGRIATPRWAQNVIGTVLVVAALGVAWRAWGGPKSINFTEEGRYSDSVAVFSFENLTGDPGNDHLGVGLADEIIDLLAQVPAVKVISRHSAEALEAGMTSIPQILSDLGARHLIQGVIDVEGDLLVVRVSYGDDVEDHLEPGIYEDSISSWFAAEARLAASITRDYLAGVGVSSTGLIVSEGGVGHEATMRGNHWLAQRTPDGLRLAIAAYREAIDLDATYAGAYAGLSNALALSLTYRYNVGMGAYEAAGMSLAYAERAVELDSSFAGGFAARGYVRMLSQAPLPEAEGDFDRARQLQPNNASIPSWSARVLARKGDLPGALRAARRAVQLDPAHSGRRIAVAYHALRAGEYGVAIDQAREALVYQEDELMLARAIEARALLLAGRSEECIGIPLGPHAVIRALCLRDLGRVDEAARIVDSVAVAVLADTGLNPEFTDVTRIEDLASYYAWIGDVDLAVVWLTRSYALSPTGVEVFLLESELFAPVRADPTFDLAVDGVRSQIYSRVQDARKVISLVPAG